MKLFLRSTLLIFVIFLFLSAVTENFEGKITVVKKTVYDTTYYAYQVKKNMIRLDEYNVKNSLISSLIIDISEEKIFALNIREKLYKEIIPKNQISTNDDNYEIVKTDNNKTINGYLCYQWRVKNKEKNSEVAYWVTQDGFYFFESLLKIWNHIGNCTEFFMHIPDNHGFFPLLAVERNLVRYEKLRIVVTDIERTNLSDNLFKIPSDYKKFEQ